MNKMVERAIAEVARLMLEEVEAERAWDERLAKSPGKLANLVERARRRDAAGEVLPYDPSNRPAK